MSFKLKALCIIRKKNDILAIKAKDLHTNEEFYRIPGGTIEFQESSIQALKREIKEELSAEIMDITLREVYENIYENNGKLGHEIDFVYTATLINKKLYLQDTFIIHEPYGTFKAEWVPLYKIQSKEIVIYPNINYYY